jgi:hypothetical protein
VVVAAVVVVVGAVVVVVVGAIVTGATVIVVGARVVVVVTAMVDGGPVETAVVFPAAVVGGAASFFAPSNELQAAMSRTENRSVSVLIRRAYVGHPPPA